ncbi:hypothetical protein IAR50_007058 [Cryptococcus sp. DSM 104548]
MPITRHTKTLPVPDKWVNLTDIFPAEICQLIFNYLLLLVQSDPSLARPLMYTCSDLPKTFSPMVYK